MVASKKVASEKRIKQKLKFSDYFSLSKGNGIDLPFLTVVILLVVIGLVMLFSASYAYALYHDKNSYEYISKQLIFAILGIIIMFIASCFNYKRFKGFIKWIVLAVSFGLMALTLILPADAKGFRRWIYLPGGGTIQPSEFLKFAVILFLAWWCSKYYAKMNTFKYGILFPGLFVGTAAGLVLIQKHLSATIIVLAIAFIMLFMGGIQKRYVIIVFAAAAILFFVMYYTDLIPYTIDRIEVWRNPFNPEIPSDVSHQTRQSLYAIGSGGLFGLGLGNSRQKYLYLPEPQNDFIFAIVCEELGFIGALIIILLFIFLIWRGFVIAMRATDRFGAMLALGIIIQIGTQVFFNIAVVSNLIPNTGISLPFFSAGGTSLVVLLAQIGIVLNISRFGKK